MTDLLDRRATYWSVLALTLVLFAITNLPWHLDDYDQAKQAFTSFEMVEQGHWIYQHTPNGWIATKPPLVGWISAGLFAVIRSWELAWRLPSFLAGLALLFLIMRAASVYGRAAALVAAAAFGLNLFSPRLASLVRTDMPLALILFVIGWLILVKIRKREGWNDLDRFWMFLLLSAAMLIKGPIIYAFLLPGIVASAWRARATGEKVTAWCGWWPWLASLAIFLLWAGAGILFVPEFLEHVVTREFAGRFSEAMHRSQPIYFYLPHLLHRFAPWSILLILLAVLGAREQRLKIRDWLRAMSPETFWLVAWSLGGLLVMSFVPSKRIDRVFPIVPPLCLLLAAQISALGKTEKSRAATVRFSAIALVIACLLTTGYAAGRIRVAYREHRDAFATFGSAVREEAAAHGWRYGVVGRDDEGVLLYLRGTEFLDADQAAEEWNSGKLDGLVLPEDQAAELLPHLPGAVPSSIGPSGPAGRYRRRYLFLVRS
ncbi:MAG TPA: glycosyltransferase family 39 protein [Chthoniobacterales bacterium]|nr:glycosyltransferase family 39 protein [Chthoniobacterales bacterium]